MRQVPVPPCAERIEEFCKEIKLTKMRWGILGTGKIAHSFSEDLGELEEAKLSAVGSRKKETALAFGEKFGIPNEKCFGSYEDLVSANDVDIIYIASPHSHHYEHMLLAIEGKKHILCEKSFTLTRAQAAKVFEKAGKAGVYVCEAMWTRFLPANVELNKRIRAGHIGELSTAWAFFGTYFPDEWPLTHRIYNPELGGGALLDMGVYAVSYISMLAGDREPESLSTVGKLLVPTKVDSQSVTTLRYPGELLAVAGTAIKSHMKANAYASGDKGFVNIRNFWNTDSFEINIKGKTQTVNRPKEIRQYAYQARAMMQDLKEGRSESEIMPHAATLTVMGILDAARHALGFYYPCETEKKNV